LLKQVIFGCIDVLIVQFNYGFFEFHRLKWFLHRVVEDGIRVFVILHSTTDDLGSGKRLGDLRPALARCEGLVVHAMCDLKRLESLELSHRAIFLPQGALSSDTDGGGRSRVGGGRTIATYGFALPHKGLRELVEAAAILARTERTAIRLLMINAEYPARVSAATISEIRRRVAELGMAEQVTLITEYLTEEASLEYLRQADLIVFGYQSTGESSSAAVRMGLAAGSPVAVTPLRIFDDVAGVVFRLPGVEPEEMAIGIREALDEVKRNGPVAQ